MTDIPGITLHVQYVEVLCDSIFLVGMAMHNWAAEHGCISTVIDKRLIRG